MYETIGKNTKLKNEMLRREGLMVMSKHVQYRKTVDGIAKHIIYSNIIVINYKNKFKTNFILFYIIAYKFTIIIYFICCIILKS